MRHRRVGERVEAPEEEEGRMSDREYVSRCCGADVEIMESEMPDSGFIMQKHLGHRCEECLEPCEVVPKEEK